MNGNSKIIQFPEKEEERNKILENKCEKPISSDVILVQRISDDRKNLPAEIEKTISCLDKIGWYPNGVLRKVGKEMLAMYPLYEDRSLFLASDGKFYFFRQNILDRIKTFLFPRRGACYSCFVFDTDTISNPSEITEILLDIRAYSELY